MQMQPSARFRDTDIIPSRSVRLSPEQLGLIDRHFDEVNNLHCWLLAHICAEASMIVELGLIDTMELEHSCIDRQVPSLTQIHFGSLLIALIEADIRNCVCPLLGATFPEP